MKLLVVSQPFGFGPTSEILYVTNHIKYIKKDDIDMLYWSNQAMNNLNKNNCLDNGEDESIFEYSKRNKSLLDVDMVLSSYDPEPILWAWWNGIESIYYNGMSSFLEMIINSSDLFLLKERILGFKNNNLKDDFETFLKEQLKINYHLIILVAMHFASKCFVRNSPNLKISNNYPEGTTLLSPLIPTITQKPTFLNISKPFIYISMSGSLAPIIDFTHNVDFVRNSFNFLNKLSKEEFFKEIEFIFICNERLIKYIDDKDTAINFTLTRPLNPIENAWLIENSIFALASPGYSTVHECAYFETPLFFLPEQNGSQPIGYSLLKKNGYPVYPNLITLGETNLADNFDEDCIKELVDLALENYNNTDRIRKFKDELIEFIQSDNLRNSRGKEQKNVIDKIFGGFQGTFVLGEAVLNAKPKRTGIKLNLNN